MTQKMCAPPRAMGKISYIAPPGQYTLTVRRHPTTQRASDPASLLRLTAVGFGFRTRCWSWS